MGWFLLGLIIGLLVGIYFLASLMYDVCKNSPNEFDRIINKFKKAIEENNS